MYFVIWQSLPLSFPKERKKEFFQCLETYLGTFFLKYILFQFGKQLPQILLDYVEIIAPINPKYGILHKQNQEEFSQWLSISSERFVRRRTTVQRILSGSRRRKTRVFVGHRESPSASTISQKGWRPTRKRTGKGNWDTRRMRPGAGRAICIGLDAFLTIGLMDDSRASLARLDRVLEKWCSRSLCTRTVQTLESTTFHHARVFAYVCTCVRVQVGSEAYGKGGELLRQLLFG